MEVLLFSWNGPAVFSNTLAFEVREDSAEWRRRCLAKAISEATWNASKLNVTTLRLNRTKH